MNTTSPPPTLSNCVEEFLRSRRQTGASHETCIEYEKRLATFTFGSLSHQSVDRYVAALLKKEVSNTRRLDYMRTLKTFGSWCVERGYLKVNPVKMPKWKGEKPNRPVIMEADYAKIQAEILRREDVDWMYAAVMGWHTGLRIGDVCCLRWECVDSVKRVLTVTPRKTKRYAKTVEIPYGDEVAGVLCAMAGRDKEFVCPALAADYKQDSRIPSRAFKDISWKAGVRPMKSFHGTRHSVVSRMLNKNISVEIIGSITGQSRNQVLTYAHISHDAKREALGIT